MHGPEARNLIIAMVLSAAVLLGWEYFVLGPQREALLREKAQQQTAAVETNPNAQQPILPDGTALAPDAAASAAAPISRDAILAQSPRIRISTPDLTGSIRLQGLRIDDLTLTRYNQTVEQGSEPVTLLHPARSAQSYFAEFGWLAGTQATTLPDASSEWQTTDSELKAGGSVTAHWDNGQGLRFERRISLDAHSMFTLEERVINTSGAVVTLFPYSLISRDFDDTSKHFFILHEGPIGVFNGALEEISYESLRDEGTIAFKGKSSWVGITDKYWLAALIPDSSLQGQANMNYRASEQAGGNYQVDFTGAGQTIAQGASITLTHRLFAGAKKVTLLDEYAERDGILLFDRAVDFGWLYFLTKPIFYALSYFNQLLGNFGLAILALTICIKLLLFPLANKSYKSMSQMKVLMPKIQAIKERCGSDKMAMNQEVMKLYQSEKVNPASGCLPILLQIPIFFSLYKVLFVTIEMRHADFYGWINDLSAPDPTSAFNLFGLIPWDPPSFLMIGAWPLIMCATMVIQMRLNPKPSDPAQALVMQWMPFVFLFLFASFPAGLVIYWAWNNTLSVAQQWLIMKRHGAK